MVRANCIIFSLIYTVTTNFNTLSKREAARIAKYIVHTGNFKYIALSNKEMESIYKIVMKWEPRRSGYKTDSGVSLAVGSVEEWYLKSSFL